MPYTAYITRNEIEYEVSAELYEDGVSYADSWGDTGSTHIVESHPTFYKFYAEDHDGVSLDLTADELESAIDQMIQQYWNNL